MVLALIANPAGIAALFIAAVYFAAAAYASYQQMNAIENVKGEKGDKGDQGPQGTVLSDNDLKEKVKAFLLDPDVVNENVKASFKG